MKKYIIYAFIVSVFCVFSACSDSYEDATSKHIYGEDENPYLRIDPQATVTSEIDFAVERLEPYVINLEDYNDLFQEKMGLTTDQVISGLQNGSVLFYNIRLHPHKPEELYVNIVAAREAAQAEEPAEAPETAEPAEAPEAPEVPEESSEE